MTSETSVQQQRVLSTIEAAYARARADRTDVNFQSVLDGLKPLSDMQIGELIDVDGRTRLALGMHIDLERYLSSVPALQSFPVALDAAIEFALRSAALQNRLAHPPTSRTASPALAPTTTAAGAAGTAKPNGPSHGPAPRDEQSEHDAYSDAIADAAKALALRYPHLLGPIQNAAFLSQELVSATMLPASVLPATRQLPSTIGGKLDDGRGRYELRQVLGEGGQGTVYLAVDRKLSEHDKPAWAAVKVLPASGRVADARTHTERSTNLSEATKARRISHQSVVRVLDVWDEPSDTGTLETVIVYEHIPGGTLETLIKRRSDRMTAREAVKLVARIAAGVQAAHSSGVVHCDLKPSNILLREDGTPAVADFGVSRRVTELRTPDTIGNGNLAFASPEQVRQDEGWATPPSDIFALGGLLFWLLTGRLPSGETADEVRSSAWSSAPLPCADVLSSPAKHGIDHDLALICARALNRNSAARYGSAESLADDLSLWLDHRPLLWSSPSLSRRARLTVKRSPGVVAATCIAAVFFVVGTLSVGYLINRQNRAEIRHKEALIKTSQAEIERKRAAFREQFKLYAQVFSDQKKEQLRPSLIPVLNMMEYIMGPVLISASDNDKFDIWRDRIRTTERLLQDAEQNGTSNTMEMLLWSDMLAYWNLRSGHYQQAKDVLAHWNSRWERLQLQENDPWGVFRAAMTTCAEVGIAAQEAQRAGECPISQEALVQHESRLIRASARLSLYLPGSVTSDSETTGAETNPAGAPSGAYEEESGGSNRKLAIKAIIRDALRSVWGPKMLNQPSKAAELEHWLE